jgi:hypothetical protein
MNDFPAPQHTGPGIPLAGNWIAITYPVNANIGMAPRLADSVLIDLKPDGDATINSSAANVERHVAKCGGKAVHGWILTQFHHTRENADIIEAAPHAVWADPDGAMLDVTPAAASCIQTCFIPEAKLWKVVPNSIFYAPSKTTQATIVELRQILAAKYVVRKYMQKNGLSAGTKASVDMNAARLYSRNLVKDLDSDIVFQFVRLEMSRQRILTA